MSTSLVEPPALGGEAFEAWWRSSGFTGDLTHMIAAKFAAHRAWCAAVASQDSTCARCGGSGEVTEMTNHLGPDDYEVPGLCPICDGTGANQDSRTESVAAGREPLAQADVPGVIEQLAKQWDECMYSAPGGVRVIDIGKAIRIDGRGYLKDSVVPAAQPPGATLLPSRQPIDTALVDRLKADAMAIFNDPASETPQSVRDVIEWYDASLRAASLVDGGES